MREIKFRGQRVDSKEWVYGYYYHDQRFINGHPCQDVYIIRDDCDEDFDVIPETVGQFTGLKDKNGLIEVYEDDILRIKFNPQSTANYKVKFERGHFMIDHFYLTEILHEAIVIGNIHENPKIKYTSLK